MAKIYDFNMMNVPLHRVTYEVVTLVQSLLNEVAPDVSFEVSE